MPANWVAVLAIGLVVGFVGGLFGKGGSAVATSLLQLAGVSPFYAVASPLPATIPATLVASVAYFRAGLYDRRVLLLSISAGVPLTILGAWLSQYAGGKALLIASNLILIGLGISFLIFRETEASSRERHPAPGTAITLLVAGIIGFISGMLANSGGFLLAPLYVRALKMPLKTAFACSLVVSAALAIPGTIVHAWLGHIDWPLVWVFGAASIPLSYLGARTAIRLPVRTLEPIFGIVLTIIGVVGAADAIGFHWLKFA